MKKIYLSNSVLSINQKKGSNRQNIILKTFPILVVLILSVLFTQAQIITTITGTGTVGYGGDNGAATAALISNSQGVAIDRAGNIYIGDRNNNVIRKVNTAGIITTIAGNGTVGYSGDGFAATAAQLNSPMRVAIDTFGNIFIADMANHVIRKVNTLGIISTVAGVSGTGSYNSDGISATTAFLNNPHDVAIDLIGNIYIADMSNSRIRKVDTFGIISTFAGSGIAGYSGDNFAATAAEINQAVGVWCDVKGNVYIADFFNNVVRKVDNSGIISTFAGGGVTVLDGVAATSSNIFRPEAITSDKYGNVIIADAQNSRVRIVDTFGIITTIAGDGTFGFSGDDGVATSAVLNYPAGVARDTLGNIYISDYYNSRVRKVGLGAITGVESFCIGTNTTLSNSTGGGKWSSSDTTIAKIDSLTGIAIGISAGIATITYEVFPYVTLANITIIPLPTAGTITGSTTVCIGSSTTLADVISSGKWFSTDTLLAKVDSITGVVSGIALGTDTISYTVTNSCGMASTFQSITLNGLPATGAITGIDSVCIGASITLSDAVLGGTWSSFNTFLATIDISSGIITGVSAGTDTISYITTNVCGNTITTQTITINPFPDAGSITGGTASLCLGSSTTFSDAVLGGTWSISNTGIAFIGSATGIITGFLSGTDTISYTITNYCGSTSSIATFNISSVADAGVITVPTEICAGSSVTLTDNIPTGKWYSIDTLIAKIDSVTGVVSGITVGTDTISYTINVSCGIASTYKIITINGLPAAGAITGGTESLCVGATTTFNDAITGGTWSSSNTTFASVGATTGIVTGIVAGTDTIGYTTTNYCGSTTVTSTINITTTAVAGTIIGSSSICIGAPVTLSDGVTSGKWISTDTLIAKIDSVTGVVTGIATGTDTISYTINVSCGIASTFKAITVYGLPAVGTITGTDSVCVGATITLADAVLGGIWNSSNTSIATINSLTKVVQGISHGIATISYTTTGICGNSVTTYPITVNDVPTAVAITGGTTSLCLGDVTTFTDGSAGGVWNSSNSSIASITALGEVTGLATGDDIISYTTNNYCGSTIVTTTFNVTTVAVSGTIVGQPNICIGLPVTLTDGVTSGKWMSTDTLLAKIDSLTGIVTGIATGTDTISYTINVSCGIASTAMIITVNSTPVAAVITGTDSVCVGANTTLSANVSGGAWSAYNTNATVLDSVVIGAIAGTDSIFYTLSNFCGNAISAIVATINPIPYAGIISGTDSVCTSASVTLSETVIGGTWSAFIGNASVADSVVTGIIAGLDSVYYSVTNSCGTAIAAKAITINTLPVLGSITGLGTVCAGSSITLTETAIGGNWTVYNSNAIIIGGVVTGVTAGTDSVFYSSTNSCGTSITNVVITINPLPVAGVINGHAISCVSLIDTFTETSPGGIWSVSNTNASIGSSSGYAIGAIVGIDTIDYTVTNGCGTVVANMVISVNPLPFAGTITGTAIVCVGATITLADAITGGIWSVRDTNATIDTGIVIGVHAGTDSVIYSYTNVCGTATTSLIVTINPLPDAGIITCRDSICKLDTTMLTETVTGGVWSNTNSLIATLAGNILTGVLPGLDTIEFTVNNSCGTAITIKPVFVRALPTVSIITGAVNLCKFATDTLTDSISGGVWISTDTTIATVTAGIVYGKIFGTDTIRYNVVTACGTAGSYLIINVDTLPNPTITGRIYACLNGFNLDTLIGTPVGGVWRVTNVLDSITTNGIFKAGAAGIDSVNYSVSNSCGENDATIGIAVYNKGFAGVITGLNNTLCVGKTITLSDTTVGGTWSASNTNASVTGGIVWGVAEGADSILYSVTDICGTADTSMVILVNPLPLPLVTRVVDTLSTPAIYPSLQWLRNGAAIAGATNATYTLTDTGSYSVEATNTFGCVGASAIIQINNLEVDNVNLNQEIKIYPNPVQSIVYVKSIEKIDVQLTSVEGRLLYELKDVKQIDLSNLANGIYFLTITDNKTGLKIKTERIFKYSDL